MAILPRGIPCRPSAGREALLEENGEGIKYLPFMDASQCSKAGRAGVTFSYSPPMLKSDDLTVCPAARSLNRHANAFRAYGFATGGPTVKRGPRQYK